MAKTAEIAPVQTNPGLERLKSGPERLRTFFGDVRGELNKVNTPSRAEVRATTAVVLFTVFAFAAFFWIVDFLINHSLNALIGKLTQH